MSELRSTPKAPGASKDPSLTTPSKAKFTASLEFRDSDLNTRRGAVAELLEAREVPVADFFQAYLPALPAGMDIARVRSALEQNNKLAGGSWTLFPNPPATMHGTHEDTAYAAMQSLHNDIIESATTTHPSNLSPTVDVLHLPRSTPKSLKHNTSQPDACMHRSGHQPAFPPTASENTSSSAHPPTSNPATSATPWWEDIALPYEYEKQEKESTVNHRQLIWDMHHILWTDPCRRFVYGISIENWSVRVWMANRAATVVSAPFSFDEEPERFIHLIISLAFASEQDLGWDPTLRRVVLPDGSKALDIDVPYHDSDTKITTYRIMKLISDHGAQSMQGRARRVFRARHNDETPIIVKDLWRGHDRKPEGETQKEMLDDIYATGQWSKAEVDSHFVKILHYGDIGIDGKPDMTLESIMRGRDVLTDKAFPITVDEASTFPDDSVGSHTSLGLLLSGEHIHKRTKIGAARDFAPVHHRVHHRLAMEDAGLPLHDLNALEMMFGALAEASVGVHMMDTGGWNHRDMSTGNILGACGKICDPEYAKRKESTGPAHSVRTGTKDFMAVEVANVRFLWRPRLLFRHNAGHDHESLVWIALFLLTSVHDSTDDDEVARQLDLFQSLFPADGNTQERALLIGMPEVEERLMMYLPTAFAEGPTSALRHLCRMHAVLVKAYKAAQGVQVVFDDGEKDNGQKNDEEPPARSVERVSRDVEEPLATLVPNPFQALHPTFHDEFLTLSGKLKVLPEVQRLDRVIREKQQRRADAASASPTLRKRKATMSDAVEGTINKKQKLTINTQQ